MLRYSVTVTVLQFLKSKIPKDSQDMALDHESHWASSPLLHVYDSVNPMSWRQINVILKTIRDVIGTGQCSHHKRYSYSYSFEKPFFCISSVTI